MELTYDLIAKRIDHSLLGPTLTDQELAKGCELAARYQVASVCIKPYAVPLARKILEGTGVAVGTTIGFPHGGHTTAVKVFEAERALEDGATELDMVDQHRPGPRAATGTTVRDDIAAVTSVPRREALVKVIFENCYLKPEHRFGASARSAAMPGRTSSRPRPATGPAVPPGTT